MIVFFADSHTNLPAMEFWANLTRGDKIRMCTHASLVQKPHLDIVVNKDKAEAEVCVVLSGNAKLVSRLRLSPLHNSNVANNNNCNVL
jgi:hypothetical protein